MGRKIEYLLDTHTFLWAAMTPDKLGKQSRAIIEKNSSMLYLSAASLYEIQNKYRLGKLPGLDDFMMNILNVISEFGCRDIPIHKEAALLAARFEWNNRDPFDRIIAAQAKIQDLLLITNDRKLQELPLIETIW
jgi:PIN domain nuclease of toxin-antitoxin system